MKIEGAVGPYCETIRRPTNSGFVGSPAWAVFNVRSQDRRTATRALNREFGPNTFTKSIRPLIKTGIMEIFQHPPTRESVFWINRITESVDRRLERAK